MRSVHLREVGSRWGSRGRRGVAGIGRPRSARQRSFVGGHARSDVRSRLPPGRLGLSDAGHRRESRGAGARSSNGRVCSWRAPGLLNPSRMRRDGAAPLIGSTEVMQGLRSAIERVAATDFTVLLEGESGVGKELVARQIHELSRRRNGPFVAINCAALVETLLEAELFGIEERTATGVRGRRGKFEVAEGGTLFLDEVSDLSAVRAGQAAARHSGPGRRARRRPRQPSRRHPDRRRDQSRPGLARRAAAVPRRPVLSPERRGHPRADAARAAARHPRAGELFSRAAPSVRGRCGCRPARRTR